MNARGGGPGMGATAFDRLPGPVALDLFASGASAVPVQLQRAPAPRMLWLNERAMAGDPAYHALGQDAVAYAAHLLAACAFVVPAAPAAANTAGAEDWTAAHADRYGGPGIGTNGGSGRTAVVNGYLVKGVGKTPLIGIDANAAHSSGGAYLEEAVRETIFSEIVEAEFPGSAIPTLAIIDTGLVQVWQGELTTSSEKRVLIVRPCMLRPAHFERAHSFLAANPTEGALDFARVQQVFHGVGAYCGAGPLRDQFRAFFTTWAQQLAYAYVHRLSPSGNSTSNICFDGKLLDFGACSSLPSWARIVMVHGSPPTGEEFDILVQSARSLAYFFGRCHDGEMGQDGFIAQVLQAAHASYRRTLAEEVLRLCGIPRHDAAAAASGAGQARIEAIVGRLFAHYRKERFDIVDFTPSPAVAWDLPDVWLAQAPEHLKPLRGLLDELATGTSADAARRRCRFISRTRPELFREEMKYRLLAAINRIVQAGHAERAPLTAMICGAVAAGRRDGRHEPDQAVPCGFAVAPQFSLALFACTRSGSHFAVIEWETPAYFAALGITTASCCADRPGCLSVQDWDQAGITLGGASPLRLACATSGWQ